MLIVVDVETTGVDPKSSSIISIGAVILEDAGTRFYGECQPFEGAVVLNEALAINGENNDTLYRSDKKTESELIMSFFSWWKDIKEAKIIAGHNTSFDVNFLSEAAKRAGLSGNWGRRSVDLHSLALVRMMQTGHEIPVKSDIYNLDSDAVMKYVGLPAEPKPHIAINGALWEAEAISRVIRGVGVIKELNSHKVPDYLKPNY